MSQEIYLAEPERRMFEQLAINIEQLVDKLDQLTNLLNPQILTSESERRIEPNLDSKENCTKVGRYTY